MPFMPEPNSNSQGKAEAGIELEPLAIPPPTPEGELPGAQPEGEPPIPQRPLHLCPNCDYNLTGLTSRRCPECGEPFNLSDARERGFELSESALEYRKWIRVDRAMQVLGLALLAFGLACPCISQDPITKSWQVVPSLKTWSMWMVLIPLSGLLILINLYYEQSWSRVLLQIGVVVAIIGLMVALL
jgi:hypothetical protein